MPIAASLLLDLNQDGTFEVNITPYLLGATVRQGRAKSLDPMAPATMTVKLNNRDGRFSPENSAGPYYGSFDENYRGIRLNAGGSRQFTGYISRIYQDPFLETQEVVLECTDRLGLLAKQVISAGRFRQQPVHLILNRLIDRLEKGEEVTNPGGEGGVTTGYSAAASGVDISAPDTISFEGDYCLQADCDGSVTGQGPRYDLGADTSTYKALAVLARLSPGDGSATLTFRGLNAALTVIWSTTIDVTDSAWVYKKYYPTVGTAYRYIEVITQSPAALTILTDGLHQTPRANMILRTVPTTLDGVAELFALYNATGLEAVTGLLATEAAGFVYLKDFSTYYGTVYASAQVVRDGETTPAIIFGDDNTNVPYYGLAYGLDADERISRVEVASEGDYSDDNVEATVWTLAPEGQTVPASTSLAIKAEYSQPARKCSLFVSSAQSAQFDIAAGANDGYLDKYGLTYYPGGTPSVDTTSGMLQVGQQKNASPTSYRVKRAFKRWDTSGIGAGSTINAAELQIWVRSIYKTTPWTLEARQPGGSAYDWGTLGAGDWSATPGSDTLQGSVASTAFPPAGYWLVIPLAVAAINKTGITALYLCSSRDVSQTAPTGPSSERLVAGSYEYGKAPRLVVDYTGLGGVTYTMVNYGVGADITLTAGATPIVLGPVYMTGVPLVSPSERSLVIKEAASPLEVPRTLAVQMPHQGTRTPDMEAEGTRLLTRYGGKVKRLNLELREMNAASLSAMQDVGLDSLVRVINTKFDFSTKIDDTFFVEGLAWTVSDQGKVLEAELYLEEK